MQRTLSIIALIVVIVLCSDCGSSSDDPNPNPNPSGSLSLTGITPDHVYANIDVTITGSGFSTTKADNLVEVGTYSSGNFSALQGVTFEVISASATTLVVRVVDAEDLNLKIQSYYDYGFRVKVGDKEGIIAVNDFRNMIKFNLSMYDVINRVSGCFLYVQAGDSVKLSSTGLYGNCTLKINNKSVESKKSGDNFLVFRIPRNHFGDLYSCVEDLFPVVIANEDGNAQEKMVHIVTSPPMIIEGASFDKPKYGPGESNAVLTIYGYSLFGSTTFRTTGPNGYEAESTPGWTGYPDMAKVDFNIGTLAPGSYNVQAKKGPGYDYAFAIASFIKE